MTRVVVVAMGSEYRRDDGAGLAVARRVAAGWTSGRPTGSGGSEVEVLSCHDPLDLLGRWDAADLAVVVDATRSGTPSGTVVTLRLDGGDGAAPSEQRGSGPLRRSTHGIGVEEVLRLARTVGTAPRDVVVVGIEGEDFGQGEGFSPAVRAGVEVAAETVLRLIEEVRRCA